MNRRRHLQAWLGAAAVLPGWAFAADDFAARLRAGACVLLMRHAQTEPGVGDPPGFSLAQCSTQRNLDERGRKQSEQWARWLAARSLVPAQVRSSAWCRCVDTARLAFSSAPVAPAPAPGGVPAPAVQVWAPLNSFFDGQGDREAQTAALRAALRTLPAGQWQAWVTHQVNITALTGESVAMGEAFVVDRTGRMLARQLPG